MMHDFSFVYDSSIELLSTFILLWCIRSTLTYYNSFLLHEDIKLLRVEFSPSIKYSLNDVSLVLILDHHMKISNCIFCIRFSLQQDNLPI